VIFYSDGEELGSVPLYSTSTVDLPTVPKSGLQKFIDFFR